MFLAIIGSTDPAPYDATQFATDALAAANGALLYIGGGIAAGLVVFAVVFGIRKGLAALRTVGK